MSLSMKLTSYEVHGRIDTIERNNGRKGEKGWGEKYHGVWGVKLDTDINF